MTSSSERSVPFPTRPLESAAAELDRPVFILSLDTELAWGSFDHGGVERHRTHYSGVRAVVTRLLELFARYQIPATWAVVGHLMLERCERTGPASHEHVLQPKYSWWPQGWLSHDPFTDVARDPFFYAPDVVEAILAAPSEQELASHTFTHVILGDPECTREVARSQLEETVRLGAARGRAVRSLICPRNRIGHLDVASELGFTAFRGPQRTWHTASGRRGLGSRAAHVADKWLALKPPIDRRIEAWRTPGAARWTFDLPASMFYPPLDGVWAALPVGRRVAQAVKGLRAAAERGGLFHLWFHPFNLAGPNRLTDGLEAILAEAARLRQAGRMETWSMAQTADYLEKKVTPTP